jgi:hypothetical protein
MIKQVLLPILGVIVFIVFVGLFVQRSGTLNFSNLISATPTPKTSSVIIDKKTIQVTIANTKDLRTKGLSGTSSLDANSGMLFVFSPKISPIFWMKDMLLPLDMVWIDNGKVVKINKNIPVPKPNTPDNKLPTYSANQPVDYVLEVNAGFADKNSIKVGDSVDISSI